MNKEMSGNIIINDLKGLNNTIDNVTGTEDIEVDNAQLLSNYRIYENNLQETRSGKNLIQYPYVLTGLNNSGLTVIDNKDGSITINGTASKIVYFHIVPTSGSEVLKLPAGKYIISDNK